MCSQIFIPFTKRLMNKPLLSGIESIVNLVYLTKLKDRTAKKFVTFCQIFIQFTKWLVNKQLLSGLSSIDNFVNLTKLKELITKNVVLVGKFRKINEDQEEFHKYNHLCNH